MIDDKDVEQALAAASAIGDDRLQRQSQGRVVPDSFTHGSQRPAHALVPHRAGERRSAEVRYVQREAALAHCWEPRALQWRSCLL